MKSFLQLSFLPRNPDLALLLLRVWLGGSMIALHGWPKMQKLFSGEHGFADPLGIGQLPTLILAVLTEAVFSTLLILGVFSRLSALMLAGTMAVAFAVTHGAKLSGAGNGELAYIYLAGFLTILVAGSGKYAIAPQG